MSPRNFSIFSVDGALNEMNFSILFLTKSFLLLIITISDAYMSRDTPFNFCMCEPGTKLSRMIEIFYRAPRDISSIYV